MSTINLGYDSKQKFGWKELPKDFEEKMFNGKLVINFHVKLWEKIKNIIKIRKKGFDTIILIDGLRRTGKSTLGKTIAYLLDPNLTINSYVRTNEETPSKIDNAKDDSVLVFDEGSLIVNSRDAMRTQNVQLGKIIDVIGQKRLTLIFCMPNFFNITKDIATKHSRFLLHVGVRRKNMTRGYFKYYGDKKKNLLYIIGKKNYDSYRKPRPNWSGTFKDFQLPFDDEYDVLKKATLQDTLNPNKKVVEVDKLPTESQTKTKLLKQFKENCPEITDKIIAKGFGIVMSDYYRRKGGY